MLKHIVMWTLKERAEGAHKRENAFRVKSMLEGLRDTIPEILRIEVGVNILDSPDSCDVVLCADFEDETALRRYLDHPEHKRVGDFIGKVRLDRKVVDFID
jgi:hypothetical protein